MNLGKTKCSIDHEVLTALAYVVMLALASLVRTRLKQTKVAQATSERKLACFRLGYTFYRCIIVFSLVNRHIRKVIRL